MCGDRKLNGSPGSPALLDEFGRHPHAKDENDRHECHQEHIECAGNVSVLPLAALDSEWAGAEPSVVSIPTVTNFAPFVW